MFLKAKLHKESRNGFKTIIYRRYPVMIFSKNWFSAQKIIKKLDVLLIFEFLCQYICIIRPVLKDLIAELLESVEILKKCWKIFNILLIFQLILKLLQLFFLNWSYLCIYIDIKIQKSTKHPVFLMIFCAENQFFEKIITGYRL